MSKRKIKLVDKKFQMRITFSLIGIILIAFMIMIALLGIDSAIRNHEIKMTLNDLDRSIMVEENIVKAFVEYSGMKPADRVRISIPRIQRDHEESIQTIKDLSNLLKTHERRSFIAMSGMIGVVILFAVFLYFYLIRLTHRISGPLHVVKGHMQKIIEGTRPEMRELREKDEFKDLYSTFAEMVNAIDSLNKNDKKADR